MLLHCSHLVIATEQVERMMDFFGSVFGVEPYFSHKEFGEFVLPSGFRVAFFRPVGKAAESFDASSGRKAVSFGVTVSDVDALYQKAATSESLAMGVSTSGPPKDHPWGEKSFLLFDPDGNRWEVTQSPTESGVLVNREQ